MPLIARFHLKETYHKKLQSEVRKKLNKNVSFTAGKDTLIVISVKDSDPGRAADIANAYVDESAQAEFPLGAYFDAAQRRLFFGQQLKDEKDALADAEVALKATQHSTGLLAPAGQAESSDQIGSRIPSRDREPPGSASPGRCFPTPLKRTPKSRVLKREIAAMQAQLSQMEALGVLGSMLEVPGAAGCPKPLSNIYARCGISNTTRHSLNCWQNSGRLLV